VLVKPETRSVISLQGLTELDPGALSGESGVTLPRLGCCGRDDGLPWGQDLAMLRAAPGVVFLRARPFDKVT
jgi:hypothetical protein